jgi:Pyruvate/2-oxoacid:ferredoxin oxidoreductase delta subunit
MKIKNYRNSIDKKILQSDWFKTLKLFVDEPQSELGNALCWRGLHDWKEDKVTHTLEYRYCKKCEVMENTTNAGSRHKLLKRLSYRVISKLHHLS